MDIAENTPTVAAVFHPDLAFKADSEAQMRSPVAKLEEAVRLANALHLVVHLSQTVKITRPCAATLFSKGKVKELAFIVQEECIALVVVDGTLTPIQQRNLEKAWHTKVIDRTALILEIFSQRARTREGHLQVALANLTYQKSRLVRSWTHLERQRGGLGFVGGPGETQIESDRRMIDQRIIRYRRQLEGVEKTRDLHRRQRHKANIPVVALVGYTNSGKSTLFNRLTKSCVLAQDKLFATLDPTMRALPLPNGQRIILSDTVGFVSDLPTHLVAAFRATLEEVARASIIVHVRDSAHEHVVAQKQDVQNVLQQLGVPTFPEQKIVEVFNKIDLCASKEPQTVSSPMPYSQYIALSAITGDGVQDLLDLLGDLLKNMTQPFQVSIPAHDSKPMSWLYAHGTILEKCYIPEDNLWNLTGTLPARKIGAFIKKFPVISLRRQTPSNAKAGY